MPLNKTYTYWLAFCHSDQYRVAKTSHPQPGLYTTRLAAVLSLPSWFCATIWTLNLCLLSSQYALHLCVPHRVVWCPRRVPPLLCDMNNASERGHQSFIAVHLSAVHYPKTYICLSLSRSECCNMQGWWRSDPKEALRVWPDEILESVMFEWVLLTAHLKNGCLVSQNLSVCVWTGRKTSSTSWRPAVTSLSVSLWGSRYLIWDDMTYGAFFRFWCDCVLFCSDTDTLVGLPRPIHESVKTLKQVRIIRL